MFVLHSTIYLTVNLDKIVCLIKYTREHLNKVGTFSKSEASKVKRAISLTASRKFFMFSKY
jgi:hypothetical protein